MVVSPPVPANERVQIHASAQVVLKLKSRWRDCVAADPRRTLTVGQRGAQPVRRTQVDDDGPHHRGRQSRA